MAIKRYVEGQGWVEIANNSSSSSKAVNVSVTDADNLFDSSNVEGALTELGHDIKYINSTIADHLENHPSGGDGPGGGILPTIKSDFEIREFSYNFKFEISAIAISVNPGCPEVVSKVCHLLSRYEIRQCIIRCIALLYAFVGAGYASQ